MDHLMEHHHLIDILMNIKQPTLHNRRIGDAALGRILDQFLIKEDLLATLTNFHQWVGSGGISNHSPIYLELAGPSQKSRAPFNFNSTWLLDPGYHELVTKYWRAHPPTQRHNLAEGFCQNLMELKSLSIEWAKEK